MRGLGTVVLFTALIAVAGCVSTITRQELSKMQSRTPTTEAVAQGFRGNELWYMGSKDGYDYYNFYTRDKTFDTQDTYRVPTAMTGNEFDYTDNHTKWQKFYSAPESGKIVFTPIETRGVPTITGPHFEPDTIIINGKTYKLVPTTAPAAKDHP